MVIWLVCCWPGDLRAGPPDRVALLPLACVGGEPAACDRMRGQLAARMERQLELTVLRGARVDRAVGLRCGPEAQWWTCLEQDANLFAIGLELDVPAALMVRVASLGEHQTVKLRWVDVGSSTTSVQLVEARPGEVAAWMSSLGLLHRRLYAPPPPPPADPWYQRWEVWLGVGAGAVVITGVALAVTLAPGGNQPADFRVRLP